jgi:hypothetical protein
MMTLLRISSDVYSTLSGSEGQREESLALSCGDERKLRVLGHVIASLGDISQTQIHPFLFIL